MAFVKKGTPEKANAKILEGKKAENKEIEVEVNLGEEMEKENGKRD